MKEDKSHLTAALRQYFGLSRADAVRWVRDYKEWKHDIPDDVTIVYLREEITKAVFWYRKNGGETLAGAGPRH